MQITDRNVCASIARADWTGVYAEVFDENMRVGANDAERLADALDRAALRVDELASLAHEERDRRARVRDWAVAHDAWQRTKDAGGDLAVLGWDEPKAPCLGEPDPPNVPIEVPTPARRVSPVDHHAF